MVQDTQELSAAAYSQQNIELREQREGCLQIRVRAQPTVLRRSGKAHEVQHID